MMTIQQGFDEVWKRLGLAERALKELSGHSQRLQLPAFPTADELRSRLQALEGKPDIDMSKLHGLGDGLGKVQDVLNSIGPKVNEAVDLAQKAAPAIELASKWGAWLPWLAGGAATGGVGTLAGLAFGLLSLLRRVRSGGSSPPSSPLPAGPAAGPTSGLGPLLQKVNGLADEISRLGALVELMRTPIANTDAGTRPANPPPAVPPQAPPATNTTRTENRYVPVPQQDPEGELYREALRRMASMVPGGAAFAQQLESVKQQLQDGQATASRLAAAAA